MQAIKPHPILAAQFIAAYLSLLIIPAFRGILIFVEYGTITTLILGQVIGFLLILTLAAIKFSRTKIILNKDFLTLKSGIFFHKKITLKSGEIKCLRTKINPLNRLLKAVNIKFYTSAAKHRADFDITINFKDLCKIEDILGLNNSARTTKTSKASNIAIFALSTSSLAFGAVTLWPIISLASEVFERNFSQELYIGIDEVTRPLSPIFPGVIAVLLTLMVLILLFSFIAILFKHSHFKTLIGNEFITTQSGFLTLFKTHIRHGSIAAAVFYQTPMLSALNRQNIAIYAPVSVSNPLKSQVILPASSNQNTIANFRENLNLSQNFLHKIAMSTQGKTRFRRFALLIIGYILAGAIILRLIPHNLHLEFAIITFLAIFITIIWYIVRRNAAKFCEINLDKNQLKSAMLYGFTLKTFHANLRKISMIKLVQNPFDKRLKVHTAQIFIANAKVVKCRMVNISGEDVPTLINLVKP